MSVNSVQQFLNVRDSHLRVVSGNVHADQMVLGGITVDTSHGLQSVTNTSNVTTNTVEFSNTTTAFVTTANVEVGGELTVSGNATVSSNLTVTANAEIGGDLTVSGNTFYSNNTSIHVDSNVVAEFTGPHGRDPTTPLLKKFPEIAFDASKLDGNDTTNTYTQAGYTVTTSTDNYHENGFFSYKLFNGIIGDEGWISESDPATVSGSPFNSISSSYVGEWVKLELPKSIKLNHFTISSRKGYQGQFQPENYKLFGSINNSTWVELAEVTGQSFPSSDATVTTNVTTSNYYKYYALVVSKTNSSVVCISEWELYGYEEDPPLGDTSVDTTFTSIMNTPQTTGANVYVDAKLSSDFTNQVTGPTPVGTAAVHDNTNKYWKMNGQLTSNVTLEANTFLEGDQPHAVSVWFNSSNLEANVSNTCVFSVSDQEKLDSVNLDLQSNTWHNLTYAYQGEGGSKVTYLDGRKVAEDQAEDTFGDYPPFAMTGYSQGGYVVSASSEATGSYPAPAHRAFDNNTNPDDPYRWVCLTGAGLYNSSGTYTGTESHTDVDGNVEQGEWLKIELPHKLKVGYFEIAPYPTNGSQSWRNYAILGSNDDSTWYQVQKVSGLSNANGLTAGSVVPTGTYKNSAFKYFVFIWGNKNADANDHVAMGELKLYGHRENDLVRLPDPTNVLKYPHVVMTGPAQRGYAVTGSTYSHFPGSGDPDAPWRSFDGITGDNTKVWKTYEMYTTAGVYSPGSYSRTASSITDTNSTQHSGEYLVLETPHKIKLSSWEVRAEYAPRRIVDYAILGSDTNSSGANKTGWTLLTSGTFAAQQDVTATVSSPTTAFKYHAIVVKSVTNNADSRRSQVHQMKLYGTGVDSIPIQIGGGNIDKVANFRVYDTFVGEDQALEIWDAQKDEFGRAKSSMTLQKGRLGIGTTEPEGRLAVLDEPHNLEEFPPRAMTAEETHFEGHGTFKVALSSADNGNNKWTAFNKRGFTGVDDADYLEWGSTQYTAATGVYTGSVSTQGVSGEWLEIEMPYKIKLEYNLLYHRTRDGTITNDYWVLERMPRDGAILGSNDGETWTTLQSWTDFDWVTGTSAAGQRQSEYWRTPGKFVTNSTAYYKTFRLVFSKLFGANGDRPNISEWRLFGTREQGQSVLHDGQLTLTKNLDIPRIGPALDADDTPRRDRLVVEYNTSTNPTFEGVVRDTSGRGFDGINIGSNSYNAGLKAFTGFSSTNYIRTNLTVFRGNVPHSHSVWFKLTSINGNWNTAINLGQNNTSNQSAVSWDTSTNRLWLNTYNGGVYVALTPATGKWYHVVATHNGAGNPSNSTMKLYVDGVKQTTVDTGNGSGGSINIDGDYLTIGAGRTSSGVVQNVFNGDISTYKLYDCALTASEVKTLYDMGRCDEGHHVVNFSKTRVGIGLGDGALGDGAYDYTSALNIRGNQETRGDIILKDASSELIFNHSDTAKWKIRHNGGSNASGQLRFDHWYYSGGIYKWNPQGFLTWNGTAQMNFTGQHKTFIKDVPFSQADGLYGLIVSSDQNKYIKMSNGIEAGSNAITTNESLPIVSLSTTTNDKKCFGVISASEDPEQRSEQYGVFGTTFEKEKGDTRVFINSVGEGAIWVVNTNGSLESGDYITTSNVAGYGQKQEGAGLMNYTVAKITMDCDFNPATQPIQIIKKDENGENVLDEHGQIQWEDHATETEKAYKVRYLTTDGTQTDEANAVHIAGFVGCTYHCG